MPATADAPLCHAHVAGPGVLTSTIITMCAPNATAAIMEVTTNASNYTHSTHPTDVSGMLMVVSVGLELIATAGIITNVLALVALKMAHLELRPVHRFLINLSITDIVICASTGGLMASYFLENSEAKFVINIICYALLVTGLVSQAGSLLILALDHYFAIVYPLRYCLILSKKYCYILIGLSWLIAFCIHLVSIICKSTIVGNTELVSRMCKGALIIYCLYIGLVLLGMTTIYIRVLYEIRKMTNRNLSGANVPGQNKKAIRTTAMIIGTYFAFVCPQVIAASLLPSGYLMMPSIINTTLTSWMLLNCSLFTLCA